MDPTTVSTGLLEALGCIVKPLFRRVTGLFRNATEFQTLFNDFPHCRRHARRRTCCFRIVRQPCSPPYPTFCLSSHPWMLISIEAVWLGNGWLAVIRPEHPNSSSRHELP